MCQYVFRDSDHEQGCDCKDKFLFEEWICRGLRFSRAQAERPSPCIVERGSRGCRRMRRTPSTLSSRTTTIREKGAKLETRSHCHFIRCQRRFVPLLRYPAFLLNCPGHDNASRACQVNWRIWPERVGIEYGCSPHRLVHLPVKVPPEPEVPEAVGHTYEGAEGRRNGRTRRATCEQCRRIVVPARRNRWRSQSCETRRRRDHVEQKHMARQPMPVEPALAVAGGRGEPSAGRPGPSRS